MNKKKRLLKLYRSKNMDENETNFVLISYEGKFPRPVRKEIQMTINIHCRTQC